MLLYAVHQEWIIIHLPHNKNTRVTQKKPSNQTIILWWWHAGHWKHEKTQIIGTTSTQDLVYQVLQSWLALMKEEKKINAITTLQSVAITSTDHAYISFDHNPLPQETSLYEKWMIVEGMLKTMRENKLSVRAIILLVNHQILQDRHLDFSCPWPTEGFLL
jgi:hypothetical protein